MYALQRYDFRRGVCKMSDKQIHRVQEVYFWCTWHLHNRRRETCIWLAAIVLFSYLAFPPWKAVEHSHIGLKDIKLEWTAVKMGRSIVTTIPLPPDYGYSMKSWVVSVDYARMFMELCATESVIAALYLTWGRRD